MGSRIAARRPNAGLELVIWNRTPGKAQPLAALGASVAATPAEAARRAEAVITMVSDSEALREVIEGTEGLAAGATDTTTLIQMSTVGPAAVQRLASSFPGGTSLLDAPVWGAWTRSRRER